MEKKELEELRIKDLCGRLPYGVKVDYNGELYDVLGFTFGKVVIVKPFMSNAIGVEVEKCKPYLRPMSSMTKEEKEELKELCDITPYYDEESGFVNIFGLGVFYRDYPSLDVSAVDWLNAHHFDYRGLIEKGLAIEAPERMYN